MKILWLINIALPDACAALKIPVYQGGGWIVSQFEEIKQYPEINLTIISAATNLSCIKKISIEGVDHIVFPRGKDMKQSFSQILKDYNPDIVHIYGTEFSHSLDMLTVAKKYKTVVNIQGIISEYAKVSLYGLPKKLTRISVVKKAIYHLKNIVTARETKTDLEKRAKFEISAFKAVKNVIGRSDWDKTCALKINPNVKYHFCNETLRKEFYTGEKWSQNTCQRYSVFISQADYAIKGLHLFLPEFAKLLKKYPTAKLFIGGDPVIEHKNKIKNAIGDYIYDYGGYIKTLIKQYNLQDNVEFLGVLSAEQMKSQYLKSNVFLSCSILENSPNSLGEAMLLEMPIVTSDVGGVSSLFCNQVDGLSYNIGENEKLVQNICKMFDDDDFAVECGKNAGVHARKTHNRQENTKQLLNIYTVIANGE